MQVNIGKRHHGVYKMIATIFQIICIHVQELIQLFHEIIIDRSIYRFLQRCFV